MNVQNWNDQAETEWLTPVEFGELIPGGLGGAAVRKWARQGKIPGAICLPNGRWKIPASAIERMIEVGGA